MTPKSILLVDDDDDDCVLFQEALHEVKSPAKLKTACSCKQLMEILQEPGKELPNLILMDVNMPGQNGFECLDSLKATRNFKDIPVIIFTTCAHQEAIDWAYHHGALHYIAKPFSFDVLKQIAMTVTAMNLIGERCPLPREYFFLEF